MLFLCSLAGLGLVPWLRATLWQEDSGRPQRRPSPSLEAQALERRAQSGGSGNFVGGLLGA